MEWPEPVFAYHGREMIETAKVRRDKLAEVAEAFHRLHARSVDVVGSSLTSTPSVSEPDTTIPRVLRSLSGCVLLVKG